MNADHIAVVRNALMIKFKSTNAEELTELTAWTIRDHLGEFVNFHISDGLPWEEDGEFFECALNVKQVITLVEALNEWLKSRSESKTSTLLIEGATI